MAIRTPIVADLSHYDKVTSFADAYASGIRGIIYKASEGATIVDTTYAPRRKDALWAGHLWGAFHFLDASNIGTQVSNFLRASDPNENTLLACDAERNRRPNWSPSLAQIEDFVSMLDEKTGQVTVLYGGELLKALLNGRPSVILARRRLWLSQYGPKAVCPPGWDKPWLVQYTGDGVGDQPHFVRGITHEAGLDLNVYAGVNLAVDWVQRVVVPLKTPDIVDKIAKAANGKIKGEAFSIPAADPPKGEPTLTFSSGPLVDPQQQKVTASDLLPVSRKVTRLTVLKHAGHAAIAGFSVDKIMAWFGMAKDARSQVEGFVSDHAWVIGITAAVVVALIARDIIGLVVDDINNGRAIASGSVTPTEAQ